MLVNNRYLLKVLLTLPCCLAIKCVRSNSDNPTITKECEGDYCFKMRTSDSSSSVIYTQDCVSGLILSDGCISDSADTRMCICSTDNCNEGNEVDRGASIHDVKCFTYEIDYAEFQQFNVTDADKGTKLGPVCVAEGNILKEAPVFHFNYLTRRVQAFPIYVHPPYDPRFNIYYHREMYRLQYRKNHVEFAQYCVEDNCNRMDFSSVKAGNVTCLLYTDLQTPTICHGQFCVYGYGIFPQFDRQVDNSESTVYWQCCLSTNSSASDYAIEVGTYTAYGTTYLICNTDNCNEDQQTAASEIEKYNEELRKDNTRAFEVEVDDTKEDNASVHQQSITNTAILVSFVYFTCRLCGS